MTTLSARSSSIQNATNSGLVPVLDDAAWLAKHLAKKAPPVPVVFIKAPPRPLPKPKPAPLLLTTREIWNLASPGTLLSGEQAELALTSVAALYGTSPAELRGRCRTSNVVTARREAIAAIRAACPTWSGSHIARFMNCDHTTIGDALAKLSKPSQVVGMWRAHKDSAHIARVTGLPEAQVCEIVAADQDRRLAMREQMLVRKRAFDRTRNRTRADRRAYNNEKRMAHKARVRAESRA